MRMSGASGCLSDSDLDRYHGQQMGEEERSRAERHLEACSGCRERDAALIAECEGLWRDLRNVAHVAIDPVTQSAAPGRAMPDNEAENAPLPPPGSFSGYEITRELHRGGQGIVYQAVQTSTKRKVALKVLLEGAYASAAAKRRFEREVELVAQLKHPNIINIFHSGAAADGRQFCVMEYVRGLPLNQYVRAKKLTLEEALSLFSIVCGAVQYAHQRGIIHRDLKPSNILVDSQGTPRVLDFGLAKWLAAPVQSMVSISQEVVGTLPYMSPEQARGNPDEIDTRTDIYSLGVILYESLTGDYPYPVVGQLVDILRNIMETPPTPPGRSWRSESGVTQRSRRRLRAGQCPIDDEVQTIVLKALSKERERRYQSAAELGRDVGHYLAGESIEAKRDSTWYLLTKTVHRHRKLIATTALITLAFGLGAIALARSRSIAARERMRAAGSELETRRQKAETRRLEAEALTRQAETPMEMRKTREAWDLIEKALDRDPNYKDALKMKFRLMGEFTRTPQDCADKMRAILQRDGFWSDRELGELRLLLGQVLQATGNDDAANHEMDAALRLLPEPAAQFMAHATMKDLPSEQSQWVEKALAADPDQDGALTTRAGWAFLQGNFSKAIADAERATLVHPYAWRPNFVLAMINFQHGDVSRALQRATHSCACDPATVLPYFNVWLGNRFDVYLGSTMEQKTYYFPMRTYDDLVSSIRPQSGLDYLWRANARYLSVYYHGYVILGRPDPDPWRRNVAKAFHEINADLEQAISRGVFAGHLYRVWLRVAFSFDPTGDGQVADLQAAIEHGYRGMLVTLGMLQTIRGDPTSAFKAFDEAIRIDPDNFLAWSFQGVARYIFWRQGSVASSTLQIKSDLDQAIRAYHDGAAAVFRLFRKGSDQTDERLSQHWLRLIPYDELKNYITNPTTESWEALEAAILATVPPPARDADAAGFYRRRLELDPRSADALIALARIHLASDESGLKDLDQAGRLARRAADVAPDFGPAHRLLGEVCLATSQPVAAVAEFEQALGANGDNETDLLWLTIARCRTGQGDAARTSLEQAAELVADTDSLDAQTARLLQQARREVAGASTTRPAAGAAHSQ